MIRPGLLALALMLAALGTGGCVSHQNERLAIGTRATPTFGGGSALSMAGPGTLQRSRWRTMVIVAPVDGVVHGPPLRTLRPVGRRADADRVGMFPLTTPIAAPVAPRPRNEFSESFGPLGRATLEPVLMPYRLVRAVRAGWWTWSPMQIWKRTRADRDRSASVGGVRRQEPPNDPAE
ncbi:MAG: hypothetical protein LAT64_04040 [Phycisphaerales bacterium]|nr:hypothetical protein [Planctomycetota bacterium]MCH8507923.1 hypothetical protein [Phycisphaerales bacterium]